MKSDLEKLIRRIGKNVEDCGRELRSTRKRGHSEEDIYHLQEALSYDVEALRMILESHFISIGR